MLPTKYSDSEVPRLDGRDYLTLRPVRLVAHTNPHAEGSCLVEFGATHVLCTASLESRPPRWLQGSGRGWVTAEYGMLPRATRTRTDREAVRGKQTGRTVEIQRLIGRSLRAACDLSRLGERQIRIDCDVLQADGGTRTAAITGGWVALALALRQLEQAGTIPPDVLAEPVAAVSCGLVAGTERVDLCYDEDRLAEADGNFVATGSGRLIEVQISGEGATFTRLQFDSLLDTALTAIAELTRRQLELLAGLEALPAESCQ